MHFNLPEHWPGSSNSSKLLGSRTEQVTTLAQIDNVIDLDSSLNRLHYREPLGTETEKFYRLTLGNHGQST